MDTYRIGDIRPNPFRDIANYPFIEEKIAALIASYENTSIWPTVVGRLSSVGYPEVAFGHHRLEAARRKYGEGSGFPVTIQDLSDADMLRMMANENMTEYAASASVSQETVRQVVLAYADGRIDLEAPPSMARGIRSAPNFALSPTRGGDHPYTAPTVAAFLGWNENKVNEALGALELTEAGTFDKADFRGLNAEQAHEAVKAVRRAEKRATARGLDPAPIKKAVAKAAVATAKTHAGHERVREAANFVLDTQLPPHTGTTRGGVPADIAKSIYKDVDDFWRVGVRVLDRTFTRAEVIRLIAENRASLEMTRTVSGVPWSKQIAAALDEMAFIATALAAVLRSESAMEKTA